MEVIKVFKIFLIIYIVAIILNWVLIREIAKRDYELPQFPQIFAMFTPVVNVAMILAYLLELIFVDEEEFVKKFFFLQKK